MAFNKEQLEKLEQAIAEGVLTVKYSDKSITYRSFEEMARLRDLIKQELGESKRGRRTLARFSKGFI